MSSASDTAFGSLTVGVSFSRDTNNSTIDQQQRKLFESASSAKATSTRAAPVVIASDGSMIADPTAFDSHNNKNNNKNDNSAATTISVHTLLANLPPPRLDFISKSLTEDASASNNNNENKKNKNQQQKLQQDGAAKNEKAADNDDDDQDSKNALKPAGRKHIGNYLTKNEVTVKGANLTTNNTGAVPVEYIISHFSELVRSPMNVAKHVVNNLFERNLTRPTVIQSIAMPLLLAKRNVVACAPTGSGKTLTFLLPMFAQLKQPDQSADATVRALVVAPTKELAAQIERETQFLMKGAPWRVVHYGHTTKGKDVFITTPQRAVSMAEGKVIDLSKVQYIVFDEGDKLWEQGSDFASQLKKILEYCGCDISGMVNTNSINRSKKNNEDGAVDENSDADEDDQDQEKEENTTTTKSKKNAPPSPPQRVIKNTNKTIAFFSATLPPKAEKLARSFMPDPILLLIKGRANANVDCDQKLIFTGNELGKVTHVKNMVTDGQMRPPVLIFVQSIERSKELYEEVRASGLRVAVLNASLNSDDRDKIVLKFRMGEIWVLITTELLARGVDFKGVATVINFDLPLTAESYVHRVGRTARAGKRGTAITFFTEADKLRLPPIVKVIHESGSEVAPYLLEMKQPTPKQLKKLERSVPNRLAVSTKKRMRVGEDRIMRMANRFCKKEEDDDDDDDNEDDFGGGDVDSGKKNNKQKKASASSSGKSATKKASSSKKKLPNKSRQAEDAFDNDY